MASASSSASPSLHSLLKILNKLEAEEDDDESKTFERLSKWNDQMEAALFGPPSSSVSSSSVSSTPSPPEQEADDDSVQAVSQHLQRLLLTRLLLLLHDSGDPAAEKRSTNNSDVKALQDGGGPSSTQELAAKVVAHFRGTDTNDDAGDAATTTNSSTCHHHSLLADESSTLSEILRTSKNWMRWYLQIYVAAAATTASNNNNTIGSSTTALRQWQSHDMLELYLLLLELAVKEPNNNNNNNATETTAVPIINNTTTARLISQLLFYAAYDQSTVQGANDFIQRAYAYLVQDLHFFDRVLTLLVQQVIVVRNNNNNMRTSSSGSNMSTTTTTALDGLALSLVRNVHSILATYPPAKAAVEATTVVVDDDPVKSGNNKDDSLPLGETSGNLRNSWTYRIALLDIMEAVLPAKTTPDYDTTTTELPADLQQQHEHHAELTLEILRTFYALCVGRDLTMPVQDSRLARCLLELLRVHSTPPPVQKAASADSKHSSHDGDVPRTGRLLKGLQMHSNGPAVEAAAALLHVKSKSPAVEAATALLNHVQPAAEAAAVEAAAAAAAEIKRASDNVEIPLATLSVLMDANPTFAEYMVQQDAVKHVLTLLERQVTHIIDMTLVDHRGAAACLPVLVVLHRFCQANHAFRHATKEAVFPIADEANFRRLVAAQQHQEEEDNANGLPPRSKNMSPLDAPVGTLRYKLIRLLTWPEGHVKRFVSELLWTLCGSDAKHFTLRVGLGNAMPFLGAKGMVELPPNTFS